MMRNTALITTRPSRPGDILRILQESHRHQVVFDPEAEPGVALSFSSTVAEWRLACDLVGTRELGIALNKWFGTRFSHEQWRTVLEPAGSRTLREVCELIASAAELPVIGSFGALGARCSAASAFVTVRAMLRDAGVDVSRIRPSSELAPYLREHALVFLEQVMKIQPGALPLVELERPRIQRMFMPVLLFAMTLLLGSWVFDAPMLSSIGSVLILLSILLFSLFRRQLAPVNIRFGRLSTFRDLSEALSAGPRP